MLKREDILSMMPGRELDEAVAIHVMGYKKYEQHGSVWWTNINCTIENWNPSNSIERAWKVLDSFKGKGYLYSVKSQVGGNIECSLLDWGGTCSTYSYASESTPEAISKAALLAVME